MRIADVFRDNAIHRPVGLEPDELRRHRGHVPPVEKRNMGKLFVALPENVLGIFEKISITPNITNRLLRNLEFELIEIVGIVELVSVFPEQPVKMPDLVQFDIVLPQLPRDGEELAEAVRSGNHCRSGVEGKDVVVINICEAARYI